MPAHLIATPWARRQRSWLAALLLACASPGGDVRESGPEPAQAPSAPAEAAAPASRDPAFLIFPHDAKLSAFLSSYPRSPDPEAALDRFFALDLSRFERGAREQESQGPLSRILLIEFYATWIRADPARATAFSERAATETSGEKAALAQEVLARAAAEPIAMAFPIEDAAVLDLLWVRYYASGDREHVRQIARTLEYARPADEAERRMQELARSEPGTPEYAELFRLLTAHAAVFGLVRHGRVDPGVRAELRELAREPGHVGQVTSSIVRSLETPQVPTWEGAPGFQAAAFLTDDPASFLARMSSPSASGPLPLTNHTRHGNAVQVIIWFAGCAAGADGHCRTVADFIVDAPDGSVYAKAEKEVWVGRPPPAEGIIQLGRQPFGLVLPNGAKPGRYLIRVRVRDEVADRTRTSTLDLFLEES